MKVGNINWKCCHRLIASHQEEKGLNSLWKQRRFQSAAEIELSQDRSWNRDTVGGEEGCSYLVVNI